MVAQGLHGLRDAPNRIVTARAARLMRLKQRRLMRAKWGVTDNNRKARFYTITTRGRRPLATEKSEWDSMASIIHMLLRGEG